MTSDKQDLEEELEAMQRRIGELEAELTSEKNRSAALLEKLKEAISAKDRHDDNKWPGPIWNRGGNA